MIEYQGRGWYLRKTGTNPRWGYFLHFISNTLEFISFQRGLNEKDRLTFMTWRGMVELLDCVIPAGCNPEDPADMGITFACKDKTVSICPVVAFVY